MSKFLIAGGPFDFIDHNKHSPRPELGLTKLCPVCIGHGGRNLQLNAYPLPAGKEDTAENRHTYCHFRAICSHCNGWGFVAESEMCSGHEWKHTENLGRCYNRYTCTKCGKINDVDSSD